MVILNEGKSIDELDLWPGDEVVLHTSYILLGIVNGEGQFVSQLDTLH